MQGTYYTSQQVEGEGGGGGLIIIRCYVHSYKKNEDDTTHTNPKLHKPICPVQAWYLYVIVYFCIVCAKHLYNSCLYVACNLTFGVKVGVSN